MVISCIGRVATDFAVAWTFASSTLYSFIYQKFYLHIEKEMFGETLFHVIYHIYIYIICGVVYTKIYLYSLHTCIVLVVAYMLANVKNDFPGIGAWCKTIWMIFVFIRFFVFFLHDFFRAVLLNHKLIFIREFRNKFQLVISFIVVANQKYMLHYIEWRKLIDF